MMFHEFQDFCYSVMVTFSAFIGCLELGGLSGIVWMNSKHHYGYI